MWFMGGVIRKSPEGVQKPVPRSLAAPGTGTYAREHHTNRRPARTGWIGGVAAAGAGQWGWCRRCRLIKTHRGIKPHRGIGVIKIDDFALKYPSMQICPTQVHLDMLIDSLPAEWRAVLTQGNQTFTDGELFATSHRGILQDVCLYR